jgi:hypothetical protein
MKWLMNNRELISCLEFRIIGKISNNNPKLKIKYLVFNDF